MLAGAGCFGKGGSPSTQGSGGGHVGNAGGGTPNFRTPIRDVSLEGGAALPGITANYRVSRVVIGGDIERIRGTTPAGDSVQGGAHATP